MPPPAALQPAVRFSDEARFIRSWLENPGTTGAVSPSSPFLARAMAARVDPARAGLVVELGPGTGPVTQALIRRGVAPERLVLVEFDERFCALLQRRYPAARVIHGDAFALATTLAALGDEPVAAVVSSLPLLNTPEARRTALLAEAFGLMGPDGVFVQFTYGVLSPIPRRAKRGHAAWFDADCSAPIWLNLPPARVWSYRRPDSSAPRQLHPAEILLRKIRQRTHKVRQELRLQTIRMREDFRLKAALRRPAPIVQRAPPQDLALARMRGRLK